MNPTAYEDAPAVAEAPPLGTPGISTLATDSPKLLGALIAEWLIDHFEDLTIEQPVAGARCARLLARALEERRCHDLAVLRRAERRR